MLHTLFRHRELLLRLVKRDLKVRYKSSSLGFLWSIAKPLLLVVVYAVVFDLVLGLGGGDNPPFAYSLFIMGGLLPWIFFAGAVGESMTVILANANLIKKVKLPLAVFPMSVVAGNLIHFILALFILFAYKSWLGIETTWMVLWLPLIILLQTVLVAGFSLMLSALNVFYRDISSAFEVLFTAWLYATPIIYPIGYAVEAFGFGNVAGKMPQWAFYLYMLNPMTPIVLAYRHVLFYAAPMGPDEITPPPEFALAAGGDPGMWLLTWTGICAIESLAIFLLGWLVFRRYSRFFADEV